VLKGLSIKAQRASNVLIILNNNVRTNLLPLGSTFDWIDFQTEFTVPAGVTSVPFLIGVENVTRAVWFDDVFFREKTADGLGDNLIKNPGFDKGNAKTEGPKAKERAERLVRLGTEYAKRGWTLLLHLDAKRKTSPRLARLAGPAGGYAAVGGSFPIATVCDLLGQMEAEGGLPDTVLFPLNMSDQAPLAVMQGSFSAD
jgi:hypothetical protein